MSTIKISQLGNVTAIVGNVIIPMVANVEGTLTTLKSNVDSLRTYVIGSLDTDLANTSLALGTLQSNVTALEGNVTALDSLVGNITNGTATFGNLEPSANVTYNLGSATRWWNELYLSGGTIYLGTATLSVLSGNLTISSPVDTTDIYTSNLVATTSAIFEQGIELSSGGLVFPDNTVQYTANAGTSGETVDLSGTVYGSDNLSNLTSGTDNVVLGNLNLANLTTGSYNTVLGTDNGTGIVDGSENVIIGYNNYVSNHATLAQTIIIGTDHNCNADQGVFIGAAIDVEDPTWIFSVGIGNGVTIGGRQAVAIGDQAYANGEMTTAIGTFSYAAGYATTSIGVDTYIFDDSPGAIAIGSDAGVWGMSPGAISIGDSAYVASGSNAAIAIGKTANSNKLNSIAIGENSIVDINGNLAIAIGTSATAYGDAGIAVGNGAEATAANTIAIGNGATVGGNDESIAIGTGVNTDFSYQIKVGTPNHIVAIPGGFSTYSIHNYSTGNTTINQTSGRVTIAAGQSSITVTNSFVDNESHVFAVVVDNDNTAYVKNVVPSLGSFTINLGAAATADTGISFFVVQAYDVSV